jgi:hypothetical protein
MIVKVHNSDSPEKRKEKKREVFGNPTHKFGKRKEKTTNLKFA